MKEIIFNLLKKHNFNILLIILLSILLPIINNIIPFLSQQLFDNGIMIKDNSFIITLSFFIIILYGFKYLFNNIIQSKIININIETISNIKKDILNSTVNLPLVFHDKNSSQYIVSRINEVDNLSKLFSPDLITFIINVITAFVAFLLILKKSIFIALLSIFIIPIFIFISNRTFKKINNQIANSLETSALTNTKMHSILNGTSTLKQFNDEDKLLKDINISIDKLSYALSLQKLTINKNSNLISFFTIAIQTFLIGSIALFISIGNLSIGDYFSLGQYISLIYSPILLYQNIKINMKPALVSYKRLKDLSLQNTNIEKKNTIKSINNITVSNLNFQYNNSQHILKNVNFILNKGDKLLISGSNGSGKTTLTKLLLGFYDNYSGNISINGVSLKTINESSLREKISLVPQKSYLFDMSLLENIKFANKKLKDNEFIEKIDYLKSIGLFKQLDLNINSIENGKNLSGGQIQRISLARVLIRNFDVCIFDEITNSLDLESKKIIKNIIKTEFNDKICIFISHDDFFDDLITQKFDLNENVKEPLI